ncbi:MULTISPECIES: hypothetical protein [Halorubrum]|uniref:Ig-like domain-containing protein n=1 Tax=Halorubrum tropicale TaxID=1765655 RepID=A0A0N0BRI9_9EURY|nr:MULTISPECIES: hypothetical protein [Halorubrum]KOX96916.1 hypothetical protein AMR74_05645 [Halorubrum tropicale]TKX45251.1 hypothetical protein EXE50_04640 [Halorubrum sp. ARQ200]TKX51575.1 hypothetical protein EXE49_01405 [Halorubrum sp. ASP121]TKX61243.1 hypothetical protein EXE48_09420 [Halorubrum sp. ASP1]
MPSTTRRAFAAGLSTVVAAGCVGRDDADAAPHWVSVYLADREATRDVTVTVLDASGATLFEESYRLSDDNEAKEDATFPGPAEPETVVVTVDDARFERDWPGFERASLPCDGPNRSGVELWIESAPDQGPDLRLEADCQHVTEA